MTLVAVERSAVRVALALAAAPLVFASVTTVVMSSMCSVLVSGAPTKAVINLVPLGKPATAALRRLK